MKVIYKMWIEFSDNTTFNYMFDNYDAVEEWLDKRFQNGNKALDIRIWALLLCDICSEYKLAMSSEIMKKHGTIYTLCEDCVGDYKIKLNKYIKVVK